MKKNRLYQLITVFLLFGAASTGFCAAGLDVTIEDVIINDDLKAEVTFTLSDSQGQPLALEDVTTPRFILARLDRWNPDVDTLRYESYITRVQTVPEGDPNAGVSAVQATTENNGIFTQIADGKYVYTFNTALPADFDRTKTHTVTGQITRTVDEKQYYANPLFHFVPEGSEVTDLRKVTTTDACNKCHNGMGFHGGSRRDVGYCITCHSPQTIDPDTGNTVDMTVMIHKIHRGVNLPSVQAGEDYIIVGHNQSVHNYSDVAFPTDNRNCTICHDGPDADVYKTAPSRMACGSCHDDINFEAGVGHIAMADDKMCSVCHAAEGNEFDISVAGAHTIPAQSQQLRGLNAEIVSVSSAEPGSQPVVRFRLTENDGTVVDPATTRTVAITYAAPNVEYTDYVREDATNASEAQDDGTFTYTFNQALPADAQATYAFAIEARRNVQLTSEITATEAAQNPVEFVPVAVNEASERRQLVSIEKCEACHVQISFHGSLRNNLDYCVTCHNPKETDIGRRPEELNDVSTVSFGYMIHKIHTGHEMDQPYTVYGYGNTPHDYSHVLFPGKRNQCNICHVGEGQDAIPALPLADEVEPIEFTTRSGQMIAIAPTKAACTSCHDSENAIAHADNFVQAGNAESCDACHGVGRNADITQKHQQVQFLNVVEKIAPAKGTNVDVWYIH